MQASISLTETQLKECSIDLSEKDPIFQKPLAQIQIFDYLEYRIWDNSTYAEVNGTLTTRQEGNTTYLKLVVEYKDGVTLESGWSGVLTTTSEETDMTPVKPFHPHITITKRTALRPTLIGILRNCKCAMIPTILTWAKLPRRTYSTLLMPTRSKMVESTIRLAPRF